MFKCRMCGEECDGSIWLARIMYYEFSDIPANEIDKAPEIFVFCTVEHRWAWFGP